MTHSNETLVACVSLIYSVSVCVLGTVWSLFWATVVGTLPAVVGILPAVVGTLPDTYISNYTLRQFNFHIIY